MSMTRRRFFGTLGLVAGAAFIPLLPGKAAPRRDATLFLRKAYNAFVKGRGAKSLPWRIVAAGDLFDAYERELVPLRRFMLVPVNNPDGIVFKNCELIRGGAGGGWVYFESPDRRSEVYWPGSV